MVKVYVIDRCGIETPEKILTPRARLHFGLALYLILERGKPVSRRHLMKLFWPDRSEDAAQHPLREALRKLRRYGLSLPGDEETQRIVLPKGDAWVDVEGLSEVEGGELVAKDLVILPGYDDGLSPAHSDWIDDTRAYLQIRMTTELAKALEKAKLAADWPMALGLAERILEQSPGHERAREVAKHARKILGRRLGGRMAGVAASAPSGVLVAQDNSSSWGSAPLHARVRAPRDTRLVGRVDDLRVLTTALQQAIAGAGRGVYLYGAPGIGKSRLVRELAEIAKTDGVVICRTTCQTHDVHRPLSVFVDTVPKLLELPGGKACYEQTYTYLNRLTQHDSGATAPKLEAHEVEYLYDRIREAIIDLVGAVAHEQPLLFIMENVQWSDPRSWALLREMTTRLGTQTVLFVFTSREGWPEESSGLCPTEITTLHLQPLSAQAALEHAQDYLSAIERTAEMDVLKWWAHVSEGNPYFTEELANNWASTGERFGAPQTLQTLTDKRLQGLDHTALQVLQACAVLGGNSTYDRLRTVLQHPDYMFLSAVDRLTNAGMLASDQETHPNDSHKILCRHDLLAERALRSLSERGLKLLHQHTGRALEAELKELHSASLLWDCAQHWYEAGNITRAVELCLSCIIHLSDVGLIADANDACQKTLQFCTTAEQRLDVITVYTRTLALAREWTEANKSFEELYVLRKSLGKDDNIHDDLELIHFNIEWNLSRSWNTVIERGLCCVHDSSVNLKHRVEAGLILLKMGTNLGDIPLMHDVYETLSPMINETGFDDVILSLTFEIIYHAICGDLDLCMSASQKLLDFARARFQGTILAQQILNCATGFRRSGYPEQAHDMFAEVFNLAITERAYALAAIAAHQLVMCKIEDGDTLSAREWADRFSKLNRPGNELWGQRSFMLATIEFALEDNDIVLAQSLFDEYGRSFLTTSAPTVAARATILTLMIRLRILQMSDPSCVATLSQELYEIYVKLRTMGLKDYVAYALYLGTKYSGQEEKARHLLTEYVTHFRRDRFPVSLKIQNAMQSWKQGD